MVDGREPVASAVRPVVREDGRTPVGIRLKVQTRPRRAVIENFDDEGIPRAGAAAGLNLEAGLMACEAGGGAVHSNRVDGHPHQVEAHRRDIGLHHAQRDLGAGGQRPRLRLEPEVDPVAQHIDRARRLRLR